MGLVRRTLGLRLVLQDRGEVRLICRNNSELQASVRRNELSEMFPNLHF